MTVARLDSVGLCAHDSRQGRWALDLALNLARRHDLQLNIFQFLQNPYAREGESAPTPGAAERIAMERKLRFDYEPHLGDFVDVGFRLCEDREWLELHRCLAHREFQVLVLPCPVPETLFGGKRIEAFAEAFACPVILVGPAAASHIRLNRPAALLAERFGFSTASIPSAPVTDGPVVVSATLL